MMAEMARVPPNLDNLMNEGIAFVIDLFKSEIPDCPVGKRPVRVMIAGGSPPMTRSTKS